MIYSRTLLLIHPIYNSLQLLIPNSQSIPTLPVFAFLEEDSTDTNTLLLLCVYFLQTWPGDSLLPLFRVKTEWGEWQNSKNSWKFCLISIQNRKNQPTKRWPIKIEFQINNE